MSEHAAETPAAEPVVVAEPAVVAQTEETPAAAAAAADGDTNTSNTSNTSNNNEPADASATEATATPAAETEAPAVAATAAVVDEAPKSEEPAAAAPAAAPAAQEPVATAAAVASAPVAADGRKVVFEGPMGKKAAFMGSMTQRHFRLFSDGALEGYKLPFKEGAKADNLFNVLKSTLQVHPPFVIGKDTRYQMTCRFFQDTRSIDRVFDIKSDEERRAWVAAITPLQQKAAAAPAVPAPFVATHAAAAPPAATTTTAAADSSAQADKPATAAAATEETQAAEPAAAADAKTEEPTAAAATGTAAGTAAAATEETKAAEPTATTTTTAEPKTEEPAAVEETKAAEPVAAAAAAADVPETPKTVEPPVNHAQAHAVPAPTEAMMLRVIKKLAAKLTALNWLGTIKLKTRGLMLSIAVTAASVAAKASDAFDEDDITHQSDASLNAGFGSLDQVLHRTRILAELMKAEGLTGLVGADSEYIVDGTVFAVEVELDMESILVSEA